MKWWWTAFLKRHCSKIVAEMGERFACDQEKWTNYQNIKQIYGVIYDEMVDPKIKKQLDSLVFMDRHGNEACENEKFGRKVGTNQTMYFLPLRLDAVHPKRKMDM